MAISYDIIIVGAGHAGCEAAYSASKLGSSVLLITLNTDLIAQMSCNPAIGGIAKGQIVREIDALGGNSGIIADKSMIQFRMLNRSKGPAMWSPRSQNDRKLFSFKWKKSIEKKKNIKLLQGTVNRIIEQNGSVVGVKTLNGELFYSKAVILTNGTFLNGVIHIGNSQYKGGRSGEPAVEGLTEQLVELGFESGRMKTGTSPRVDGKSLDFHKMEEQPGDTYPGKFSFTDTKPLKKQKSCFITYTNPAVHDALKKGFKDSPLFSGNIKGTGPRYCPSIEDKIIRFSQRDRHQIFVEPDGWNTDEMYINGFSTSLPEHIQYKALKQMPGFENVSILKPGYAIEYDYFPPMQLSSTLETKLVKNLFFAGQINGTTGYEEAAAQGLVTGINAHQSLNNQREFVLKRSEAYIGVLIDDLINKGTDEPYRMFTSRAEFRTLLRHDNADQRLTPLGHQIGLASDSRFSKVNAKKQDIKSILKHYNEISISPTQINGLLQNNNSTPILQKTKLSSLLLRPQINISMISKHLPFVAESLSSYPPNLQISAEINLKYHGYIVKEQEIADKMIRLDHVKINQNINFNDINSLSSEAKEKLIKIKPRTIGQAARISGVSPADVSVLMIYLGR